MVSTSVAACLVALLGAGSPELLDFTATWCGPCRSMQPKVEQLAAAGYAVRQVDVDREPELARKFGVREVPCFVLVADGRQIDRIVGLASVAELRALCDRGGAGPVKRQRARPTSLRATSSESVSHERLLAASARLTVIDDRGQSHGSGTLIDARDGEALIVTCGHIFRDSQGRGKILVDLFGPAAPKKVPGRLVSYDLKRDVGLVAFRPGVEVSPARLAPQEQVLTAGVAVASVGCDGGADPTVIESRVTGVNGFLGPPNVQVAGQPVQGRSGGGLFTPAGMLVGVCNAADPQKNEGLYAAAATIHEQLDAAGLAHITNAAAIDQRQLASDREGPPGPRRGASGGDSTVAAGSSRGRGTADFVAQDDPWRVPDDRPRPRGGQPNSAAGSSRRAAEVICIVRSLDDPSAESEVVVLDRASPTFLDQLASERRGQEGRHLTSLDESNGRDPRREVRTSASERGTRGYR